MVFWRVSRHACANATGDPVSFEPAFEQHSSVQCNRFWVQLLTETNGTIVTSAMCAVRAGYPMKLENYIMSPNLVSSLGQKLASFKCAHVYGTHTNNFAGEHMGGLSGELKSVALGDNCHSGGTHECADTQGWAINQTRR